MEYSYSATREFRGTTVLVTGTTGYLGSLVLEQLLRMCSPSKIYVLMRSERSSAASRLQRLLEGPLFHMVRDRTDLLEKVVPIPGDLLQPGLGLTTSHRELLLSEVGIILHCAADTRPEGPMHAELQTNYEGTQRLLELAAAAPHLRAFLHVSAAEANGNQPSGSTVQEQLYCLKHGVQKADPLETAQELLSLPPCDADMRARVYMARWGFHSTHAFSKHLAEQLVGHYYSRHRLPLAIVRPSLLTPVAGDPCPGYSAGCSSWQGPGALAAAMAAGFYPSIKAAAAQPTSQLNMIPGDMAASIVLAAAAATAAGQASSIALTAAAAARPRSAGGSGGSSRVSVRSIRSSSSMTSSSSRAAVPPICPKRVPGASYNPSSSSSGSGSRFSYATSSVFSDAYGADVNWAASLQSSSTLASPSAASSGTPSSSSRHSAADLMLDGDAHHSHHHHHQLQPVSPQSQTTQATPAVSEDPEETIEGLLQQLQQGPAAGVPTDIIAKIIMPPGSTTWSSSGGADGRARSQLGSAAPSLASSSSSSLLLHTRREASPAAAAAAAPGSSASSPAAAAAAAAGSATPPPPKMLIVHACTSSTYPVVALESWNWCVDLLRAFRPPFSLAWSGPSQLPYMDPGFAPEAQQVAWYVKYSGIKVAVAAWMLRLAGRSEEAAKLEECYAAYVRNTTSKAAAAGSSSSNLFFATHALQELSRRLRSSDRKRLLLSWRPAKSPSAVPAAGGATAVSTASSVAAAAASVGQADAKPSSSRFSQQQQLQQQHPSESMGWRLYAYTCIAAVLHRLYNVEVPGELPHPEDPHATITHHFKVVQ